MGESCTKEYLSSDMLAHALMACQAINSGLQTTDSDCSSASNHGICSKTRPGTSYAPGELPEPQNAQVWAGYVVVIDESELSDEKKVVLSITRAHF